MNTPFWSALHEAAKPETPEENADVEALAVEINSEALELPKLTAEVVNLQVTPLARFFAAHEQIAFLEVQLKLAKASLKPLLTRQPWLYLRLRWGLVKTAKTIDRFDLVLKSMAFRQSAQRPLSVESIEALEMYAQDLQRFFETFAQYIDQVGQGAQVQDPAFLFALPKQLSNELKAFQKGTISRPMATQPVCRQVFAGNF